MSAPPIPAELASNPPLLGYTPTSINQIILSAGQRATRFPGPLVCGRQSDPYVPGAALLSLPLLVDYTMGSFSLPMQFPRESVLLWAVNMVYASFAGGTQDTSFQLGTGSGRNDILAADGFGAIHTTGIVPVTGTLPFEIDPNPFQAWLTVTGYGNTAGSALLILLFMRCALQWS